MHCTYLQIKEKSPWQLFISFKDIYLLILCISFFIYFNKIWWIPLWCCKANSCIACKSLHTAKNQQSVLYMSCYFCFLFGWHIWLENDFNYIYIWDRNSYYKHLLFNCFCFFHGEFWTWRNPKKFRTCRLNNCWNSCGLIDYGVLEVVETNEFQCLSDPLFFLRKNKFK